MAGDTRDRMIDAAVHALRRDGLAGMSFTDILRESGAARGAIYHHFPGGKSQLATEAATVNGREVRALFGELPAPDPVTVLRGFLGLIRPVVQESAGGSGCAVAAVAMAGAEERDHGRLVQTAGASIGSWIDALAGRLATAGMEAADAQDLASLMITTLEGAHVLARAVGRIDPFDQAARALITLAESRYAR